MNNLIFEKLKLTNYQAFYNEYVFYISSNKYKYTCSLYKNGVKIHQVIMENVPKALGRLMMVVELGYKPRNKDTLKSAKDFYNFSGLDSLPKL